MNNKKVIVFEGGDGLGKTTLAKFLIDFWPNINYTKMPSEQGDFKFLYDYLKHHDNVFTPFETQLLLTVSNFNVLNNYQQTKKNVTLFDRSPMSTLAYLLKTGEGNKDKISILIEVIKTIGDCLNFSSCANISFVIFQGTPFKEMASENTFEKKGVLAIDDCYNIILDILKQENKYIFAAKEKYFKINVTNKNIKYVYAECYDFLQDILIG